MKTRGKRPEASVATPFHINFRDSGEKLFIFDPLLRPYGLAVRTPPFHGGSPGSIPGRVAIQSSRGNFLVSSIESRYISNQATSGSSRFATGSMPLEEGCCQLVAKL